jgi:hypothetical protein
MQILKKIEPQCSLQKLFATVVARAVGEFSLDIELLGRMGKSTRQVDGLFESLLAEVFS